MPAKLLPSHSIALAGIDAFLCGGAGATGGMGSGSRPLEISAEGSGRGFTLLCASALSLNVEEFVLFSMILPHEYKGRSAKLHRLKKINSLRDVITKSPLKLPACPANH